ncbi:hypothetical protein F4810DRAFT_677441 [Camillea tinctor]|nr:hypothetical protein F4810DRAFT_677441 [Camillea tinctor]
MYIQATLAILGLASTAVATFSPEQLNNLRAAHDKLVPTSTVQPRQVSYATLPPACTTSALSIVNSMPYATGDLARYLDSFDATVANPANPTNFCAVTAALPATLQGPYSAFDQQASTWYSSNSAQIQSLLTSCGNGELAMHLTEMVSALESYTAAGCTGSLSTPGLTLSLATPVSTSAAATSTAAAGVATGFVGILPSLTEATTAISSSSTATTNQTSSDNAVAASATSSVDQGAAARPTGALAGAMAAAGLLGAVMML